MLSNRRRGFTLIELLVVIAIIAVLAGILFPVFAMVRRKARMTADATALHQIGVAMSAYLLDHNQLPPPDLNVFCQDGARYLAPGDLVAKRDATGSRTCSYQDDGYGNTLYNLWGLDRNGFAEPPTTYFASPTSINTAMGGVWPPDDSPLGPSPADWTADPVKLGKWSDFPMMRNKQRPKYTIVTTSRYNQQSNADGDPPYDNGPILVLRVDGTVKTYADKSAETLSVPVAPANLTPFQYQSLR